MATLTHDNRGLSIEIEPMVILISSKMQNKIPHTKAVSISRVALCTLALYISLFTSCLNGYIVTSILFFFPSVVISANRPNKCKVIQTKRAGTKTYVYHPWKPSSDFKIPMQRKPTQQDGCESFSLQIPTNDWRVVSFLN